MVMPPHVRVLRAGLLVWSAVATLITAFRAPSFSTPNHYTSRRLAPSTAPYLNAAPLYFSSPLKTPPTPPTTLELPTTIEALAKEIADCALMAISNGEVGLTIRAGAEFDASSPLYNPTLFINLVLELSKKLCILGQTRVLFRDASTLDQAIYTMQQLAYTEANREQAELAQVEAMRRQFQAKHPNIPVPAMPAPIVELFETRQRESARLAQFIRWGNLFGQSQPTDEEVTADSAQATARAAAGGLDANDRMYILVSPHPTAASLVAVRSVIQSAGRRPVIVLNPSFTNPPVEMSVFSPAYSFDQWLSEVNTLPQAPLSQSQPQPTSSHQEILTVLIRKFPMPWQLYAKFLSDGPLELVQSYEYAPGRMDVERSMLEAIKLRGWMP